MKDLFGGFYGTSEIETKALWNNRKSVFVFDTNALLLLYRCERETREAFFSQWEKIRDRVFLPYHVCLEYQRNRLTAIKDHVLELKNAGSHIAQRVIDASNLANFEDKQATTIRRYESLRGKVSELSTILQSTVDEFVKEQIDSRIHEADFLSNHDTVRDRISELATSRIGTAPTQEKISKLETEGEERYKKQIPPGFEDAKNKGEQVFQYNGITYKRKYGDWFIWNEILSHTSENKPAAVIFVTNENKKDWLFETGGKTRGPLESLKTEIASNGGGTKFLLYSSASFLIAANEHLQGEVTSSKVIKELERATEENIITDNELKSGWLSKVLDHRRHHNHTYKYAINNHYMKTPEQRKLEEFEKDLDWFRKKIEDENTSSSDKILFEELYIDTLRYVVKIKNDAKNDYLYNVDIDNHTIFDYEDES